MISIFRIEVTPDYEAADGSGASPLFQIANINGYFKNDEEVELLSFIGQGDYYENGKDVLDYLKENCSEYNFRDCKVEIV